MLRIYIPVLNYLFAINAFIFIDLYFHIWLGQIVFQFLIRSRSRKNLS